MLAARRAGLGCRLGASTCAGGRGGPAGRRPVSGGQFGRVGVEAAGEADRVAERDQVPAGDFIGVDAEPKVFAARSSSAENPKLLTKAIRARMAGGGEEAVRCSAIAEEGRSGLAHLLG